MATPQTNGRTAGEHAFDRSAKVESRRSGWLGRGVRSPGELGEQLAQCLVRALGDGEQGGEGVDQAWVVLGEHVHAGGGEPAGIGKALVPERVVVRDADYGGCDGAQVRGVDGGDVGGGEWFGSVAEVVPCAGDDVVEGEEVAAGVLVPGGIVTGRVDHGVEQQLCAQWPVLVPELLGHHRGEVAARAVPGDRESVREAAEVVEVLGDPGGRGEAVVEAGREGVLRGESVVDGDEHQA